MGPVLVPHSIKIKRRKQKMRLDSEEQRNNLMQLVLKAPLNGSFDQIAPTVMALNALGEIIKNAPLDYNDLGAKTEGPKLVKEDGQTS
jgi:hypothetical protein